MNKFDKELSLLFSKEILLKLIKSDSFKIAELNSIICLLIKANIPFDTLFTSGTRRNDPSLRLTIYINPQTTISFNICIDNCSGIII